MRRALVFALTLALGAGLAVEAQTARNGIKVSRLPVCNLARQGWWMSVNDAAPDCLTGSGVAGSGYAICQCDPLLGWLTYDPGDGYLEGATAGGGLELDGVTLGIRTDCDSAEVLAWDGDSWECAAAGGGPTNYAGSASPAGPATSALSVTGFTASKCARFDGSGALVAASGDCSAGATSGIGGTVGATPDAIPTASGTGGSTVQASTVKVVSGNLILPSAGQLGGNDNYVRVRPIVGSGEGGLNIGPAGQDPPAARLADASGTSGTISIALFAGNATTPVYSYTGDADTGTARSAADVLSFIAGGVEVGQATIDRTRAMIAIQIVGRSAPPFTCDAAAEGSTYYDSDIHDHCDCSGASPAWSPRHLVGSCS